MGAIQNYEYNSRVFMTIIQMFPRIPRHNQ